MMDTPVHPCWKGKNYFARKAVSMDVLLCLILLFDF